MPLRTLGSNTAVVYNPLSTYMSFLSELSPSGRLRRMSFWLRHLTVVPLAFWLVIGAGQSPGAPADLPIVLLTIALLVSIWGRRLHDRGHSAWWLLAVFIPVIGMLGLVVECALRGSSLRGDRFGPAPGARTDYLTVQTSDKPTAAQ